MKIETLPETPAGKQAAWILDRFGHLMKGREIHERFAPSFLEAVSPLKVRAVTLSMKVHLPLTIIDVNGDDFELQVSLDGAQGPLSLRISVDTDEPHPIIGLLVQPAGPTVRDALRDASPRRDIGALIEEHVGPYAAGLHGHRTGVAVAVRFENDTTVSTYGAVSEDSVFEIGSITKPVTATLLAELVASLDVALDDPVKRYLPTGRVMPPAEGGGPITLLELATHSSGLPRLPVNLEVRDENDPYATFTTDALFEGLSATPLQHRGTVAYSNLGYALLGQVLARAVGSSYEDLVTRRVLVPLGMVDASVGPHPTQVERRLPGHREGEVVPHWTMTAIQPAGGIEASSRDLLAFGTAHASADPGSPLAVTQTPRLRDASDARIGLAWIIEETERGDVHWHNGGTGGFQSFVGFHRGSGTAIAVLTNTSDGEGPDVAAAAVLGGLIGAANRKH